MKRCQETSFFPSTAFIILERVDKKLTLDSVLYGYQKIDIFCCVIQGYFEHEKIFSTIDARIS